MREYKIFKTDLWFGIFKKNNNSIWFLSWNNRWWLRKEFAKTFYHREDAVSALVILKKRDEQSTD